MQSNDERISAAQKGVIAKSRFTLAPLNIWRHQRIID